MFEDLLDDHRVFNTGNDLHVPTTVPAGLYVDSEYAFQTLRPVQLSGLTLLMGSYPARGAMLTIL